MLKATCQDLGWNLYNFSCYCNLHRSRGGTSTRGAHVMYCNLCTWAVVVLYGGIGGTHPQTLHKLHNIAYTISLGTRLRTPGMKLSTLFICYATCADVNLVQIRGESQYTIYLLCNLCRCQTCAGVGWISAHYSFFTQLVQMSNMCRWGVEFSTLFITLCVHAQQG